MAKINQFGYREELNRTMGAFSSFAISFSLISVLTGIFANFHFVYKQAGWMILWTWLLVACGQFVVALVMASLSIRFPIAGYGYQWAARLVNTHYGFFVGWMLLVQFITGFPGICQTFTIIFFGLIGAPNNYEWVTIGTIVVISIVTFIHLLGIKYASKVNDLGVYAELVGVLFLLIVLSAMWLFSDPHPLGTISKGVNPMQMFTLPFSSLALSLLLGAWCLTGFEAAADLAEETQSPLRNVPRAVIFSLVISAICGGLIILLFIVQASNFSNINGDGNVLLLVLEETIGYRMTIVLLLFILFSIFACAVAALATVSRLLFSLSRDQLLPFSAWVSKVDAHTQTPKNSLFLIWGLSICVIVFFKRLEIITNISALAAYVGYAGIMLGCLVGERQPQTFGFHASKRQRAIQWVAFLWTLLVIAALSIPETRIEGFQMLHLPAFSTAIAGFIGVLLYLLYVRKQIQIGQAGPPKIY